MGENRKEILTRVRTMQLLPNQRGRAHVWQTLAAIVVITLSGIAAPVGAVNAQQPARRAQAADSNKGGHSRATGHPAASASEVGSLSLERLANDSDLIYKREIFTFPVRGLAPFESIITRDDAISPHLADLAIEGLIVNPDPSKSIAMLRVTTDHANTEPLIAAHIGQRIGNFRVTTITPDMITAEVIAAGRLQRVQMIYSPSTGH